MANELTNFIKKNQRTIGIIALILFAIGVFSKNQGIDTILTTGSIISFSGASFGFGIFLIFLSIVSLFFGTPFVFLALFLAGLVFTTSSQLIRLIELLVSPTTAIIIGLILLIFIFRKRKG